MKKSLRPYQEGASNAAMIFIAEHSGNSGIVVLPTGTGKSLLMADLISKIVGGGGRVLMCTHVEELIAQNFRECISYDRAVEAGINAASIGKADFTSMAVFCSIQTVHKKSQRFRHVDVLLVDECHLVSPNGSTMYQGFIRGLRMYNPKMVVIGLTATPFRLDSGMLHEGDSSLFDTIIYDYNIKEAFDEGYLTRPTTKSTKTHYDLDGVATRGGEYVAGDLERAVNIDEKTIAAINEVMEKGANRKSWLLFCSGVAHAEAVAREVRSRGIECAVVTGETPRPLRRKIIEDFKGGRLRCIANANVLTTGFDAPNLDLIAMMRPTKSASLYIQIIGRGTRNMYEPGHDLSTREGRLEAIRVGQKPNCLVLDFANNINRFGPIDMIEIKQPKKGDGGPAPVKECPDCGTMCHASVRLCGDCGFEFPEPEVKVENRAATGRIVSDEEDDELPKEDWRSVIQWYFQAHEGPKGLIMKVSYQLTGMQYPVYDWVSIQGSGYAREKAVQWWIKRGGQPPAPRSVAEAIGRSSELIRPAELKVIADGKYFKIDGYREPIQRNALADNAVAPAPQGSMPPVPAPASRSMGLEAALKRRTLGGSSVVLQ